MFKNIVDSRHKLQSEMHENASLLFGRLYVRKVDVEKTHEFSKGFDMLTLENKSIKNEMYRNQ